MQANALVVVDRNDVFPASSTDELSLCSWNMLAPCLHEEHPGSLKWSCRRSVWLQCLKRIATCDVLCFQEVDRDCVLDELTNLLGTYGFEAVAQGQKGRAWGNVTFFRTSSLRLVWSESRSRTLLTGFALPDGCIIGVVNVHLEAGSTETNEAQRVSMLTSALHRLREYGPPQLIVAGDFNSSLEHGSELRDLLAANGLSKVPVKGLTFSVPGYADTLDHIWATEGFQPRTILGSEQQALDRIASGGLPNSTFASDHLPVAATFSCQNSGTQTRQSTNTSAQTGQCTSAQLTFNGVPCDCSMVAAMCQEWLHIMEHARQAVSEGQSKKKAMREQRDLEKAFSEAMGEEIVAYLRQWHSGASEAARSAVADTISIVLARMQSDPGHPHKCSTHIVKNKADSDENKVWDPGTSIGRFW